MSRLFPERSRAPLCIGLIACLLWLPASALAAEGGKDRPSEFLLIVQIMLLIGIGRGLGELMQRVGQPSIIGELLAGLILGPSILGAIWPEAQTALFPNTPAQKALIDGLAQFGILLLLLLTGMETDLKLVRKVGRAAAMVSLTGIAIPFACGFALGQLLPDELLPHPEKRLVASLFLGTALSISSVKIVAVVVREMQFMRRNVGQIIIASAVIDDTIGWIIIAIIFSLASQGTLDVVVIAKSVIGTLVFLGISLTIGRRLVFQLIRWANDHLRSDAGVITIIILLMSGMALITHAIGVHTVLGAFVAGILIGESPILTRQIDEQLRGLIASLFMPVFFGLAGLTADLTVLTDPYLLGLTAALVLIASFGKFGGAFAGGALGRLTRMESLALASGMNARGSTEVIIATIGLSMGVLSQTMFTMIVTMAIVTTMAMPPMLRAALARLPLRKEEEERLQREEFEREGFVSQLERYLVAVDGSANGTFAARVAGLLAGPRGRPTTILHVGAAAKSRSDKSKDEDSPESAVKAAAKATVELERLRPDGQSDGSHVDVTTQSTDIDAAEAVAREAEKGFDLLLVGLDDLLDGKGEFTPAVERIAEAFGGPVALARSPHTDDARVRGNRGALRILLPVTGSRASHGGAEVAIALARAMSTPIRLVYVATETDKGRTIPTVSRTKEEAALKDVATLADRYGVTVTTRMRARSAPADVILQEAKRSSIDLIVMGVTRAHGDRLDFGSVAAAVMRKAETAVLLVAE